MKKRGKKGKNKYLVILRMAYPNHPTVENLLAFYKKKFEPLMEHAGTYRKDIHTGECYWLEPLSWWDHFIDDCITQDLKDIRIKNEKIRQKMRESNNADYRFVTVGYPNDISAEEFVKKWRDVEDSKWNWGDDRITRFEFYRENGKYHPHVHMYIYTNKKRCQIIKELSTKSGLDKNYIDVKSGRSETHMNYIKGIKREEKHGDMDRDAKVRETLGISEYEYSERLNLEKI